MKRLTGLKGKSLRKAVAALLCLLPCLLFVLPQAGAESVSTLPPTASPSPSASSVQEGLAGVGDMFPLNLAGDDMAADEATSSVQILLILTVLTLLPSILIMVTGFTRIIIVLSFTRNAMGTQQMPPNQVMVGLALFLTFFVMYPVYTEIKETAWEPFEQELITFDEAKSLTMKPLRAFMYEQIVLQGNQTDLRTFMGLAKMEMPGTLEDIPSHVLIPAFITSEIKTAFMIGFLIYLPFIVIDMIVASALMSMGMMMLPPVMISLPFKIMLFVLVDGWNLTVTSLIRTFSPG